MMGLPENWVTDPVLGLSRTQQLKMLGNGVVTQQAVAALKSMGAHASGKDLCWRPTKNSLPKRATWPCTRARTGMEPSATPT